MKVNGVYAGARECVCVDQIHIVGRLQRTVLFSFYQFSDMF